MYDHAYKVFACTHSLHRITAIAYLCGVESVFVPLVDCVLSDPCMFEVAYLASRDQPCVQWVQVFQIVERKAEEIVCCGVVVDVEIPAAILSLTCAFNIDLLSLVADEIISVVVHRHNLNIFEYVAQDSFCDMYSEI